jgi:N-acetylated-alpha-linked acidic dipeptidase
VAPKKEDLPPHLNFAPLDNAVEALSRSSAEYQKALERFSANGGAAFASASVADVNELLLQSERKLTSPQGLPGRFWYKHELYAPGTYTGYAAKAIPAVRENLEQKKWKEAEESAARVAKVLEDESALISAAAAKLSAAAGK